MKKIMKWLFIVLGFLLLVAMLGMTVFKATYKPSHLKEETPVVETDPLPIEEPVELVEEIVEEVIPPTKEELRQKMIDESDRVNVLLFGTDGFRADTLIFLSYSEAEDNVTMISIPRDTKNEVEGMDALGQDKINAVFCFPDGKGGSLNQKKAIEALLNVPIHYYVKVNYNGLKAIVNTIGGVEIDVPFDMDYDDVWAEPELHIHLKAGQQLLDGEKAMQYIRWRKNNDGKGDSDLARTARQQDFIIKVVKKSFGINITKVINICYDYVKTDMNIKDLLYYGSELMGFDFNAIDQYHLPGEADNRYFYQDVEKTEDLILKIYTKTAQNE